MVFPIFVTIFTELGPDIIHIQLVYKYGLNLLREYFANAPTRTFSRDITHKSVDSEPMLCLAKRQQIVYT